MQTKQKKLCLYQYRPLRTRANIRHLISDIKQKVWFNQISDFNDPFECAFLCKPSTPQEFLDNPQELTKLLISIQKNDPSYTQSELKKLLLTNDTNELLTPPKTNRQFF